MKKNVNDITNSILKSINLNNFEVARVLYNNLCSKTNESQKDKLSYLLYLINEREFEYKNKNTQEGQLKQKYIRLGNLLYNQDKKELAIYAFKIGYRETKNNEFLFHLGKIFYENNDYNSAKSFFKKYIKNNGAKFFEESYTYIFNINLKLLESKYRKLKYVKSETIRKRKVELQKENDNIDTLLNRIKLLKSGIFNKEKYNTKLNLYKIKTNDEEIETLVKSGKLNDVKNIFDVSEYEKKITILAILYLKGYANFADKILKEVKDNLNQNCPVGIKALNKNRTLYISKSKFNK